MIHMAMPNADWDLHSTLCGEVSAQGSFQIALQV